MTSSPAASGQRHDRLDEGTGRFIQISSEQTTADDGSGDITVLQRMLSATAGSLLTSLLVTPLDVVRVRLQAQASTNPSTRFLSTSTSNFADSTNLRHMHPTSLNTISRLPAFANIGVTSCCREVFWANNVASHCFVAPSSASVSMTQVPLHVTSMSGVGCVVEETQNKVFTSTWDGLKKIAKSEGLISLWRGLSPTLVMAVPGNVIYFSGYDGLRYGQASPIRTYVPDEYVPLVAGSFARAFAAAFISPIEMFRTRMQATSGGQKGVIRQTLVGMQELVAAQGYTSLWRGLTLTMWRDVPFSGIYWWGYEAVRNRLTDVREQRRGRESKRTEPRSRSQSREKDGHAVTLVDSFIAGAVSGSVASILTMPFDVGKTRQQIHVQGTDGMKPGSVVAKGQSRAVLPEDMSMPRFLLHIYQQEGFAGLFRGWIPRTMKVAPACAIMISSYELGKKFASKANVKRQDRTDV